MIRSATEISVGLKSIEITSKSMLHNFSSNKMKIVAYFWKHF